MINTNKLNKIFGYSNIIYAVTLFFTGILWQILFPVSQITINYSLLVNSPFWILVNLVAMLAVVFGVIGFFGFLLRKNFRFSFWSILGLCFILISLLLRFAMLSWEAIIWPSLLEFNSEITFLTESLYFQNSMIMYSFGVFTLLFSLGYLIFGIASLRNNIFSKKTSYLLMFGAMAHGFTMAFPFWIGLIGAFIYCLSIYLVGFEILKESENGDN